MQDTAQLPVHNYSIRDIVNYRDLPWVASEEFLFLTEVPLRFEPYFVQPSYYCVGMITEGSLEININHQSYALTPNDLMVYRPGQVFRVHTIAAGTTGAFVLFTRKFLNYLDENIFSVKDHSFLSPGRPTLIPLAPADRDHLLRTFREIFALLQHLSKRDWELIARNLISALVYETDTTVREYLLPSPAGPTEPNRLFDKFMLLVRDYFQQHRNLAFYADALCVSPGHLHAVVKKVSGKSPTTLIQHQVVRQAKHLLAAATGNVGEIAYQLAFSDPFAFSKFFKKHTGFAPSQYRERAAHAAPLPVDLDME